MSTIMIVDDDRDYRKLLETVLQKTDHRLLQASDGAEAIRLVRTEHPDLVLAQFLTPTMNGIGFVRQTRIDPATAHIPVILMTGIFQQEQERRQLAEVCGAHSVLPKPCDPEEILRLVVAALSTPSTPTPLVEKIDRESFELLTITMVEKLRELETTNRRIEQQAVKLKLAKVAETVREQLIDNLPVAAYSCDAEGLITTYNQHAVRLWGRAPKLLDAEERFCGAFKLFTPTGKPVLRDQCWMAEALHTGKSFNGNEIIIEREGGSRITALVYVNPIRDEVGGLIGAINVLLDFTEQSRSERQFRLQDEGMANMPIGIVGDVDERKKAQEAVQKLAAIVTETDDAIFSITLDGHIENWNPGAERTYRYSSNEVVGRSWSLLVPSDRASEVSWILGRLEIGEAIEHYETVRVRKDGRRIDVSLTVSPIRARESRSEIITGAAVIARDISEQKRVQEELRMQQQQIGMQLAELEDIYRYAPVGLVFVDRDLRYVRLNEQLAAINGRPVAEHIGRTIREIVPELAGQIEPVMRRAIASAQPILNIEVNGVTAAEPGVRRSWLQSLFPLQSSDGTVVGVNVAIAEITDRKRTEDELRLSVQEVKTLSRRILQIQEEERAYLARELHDELGQMLTVVGISLQNMKLISGLESYPSIESTVSLVDRGIEQVRQLSFDLRPPILDILGLEVALQELVDQTRARTKLNVKLVGHIDISLRPEMAITCYRVVQEALTNIVRHSSAREAQIMLKYEDNWLALVIQDDGIGFDMTTIRFGSVHPRNLGLLGMQERVELAGGRFEMQSTPGSGTKVYAGFPLTQTRGSPGQSQDHGEQP